MKTKRKKGLPTVSAVIAILEGLAASLITAVLLALVFAGVSLLFEDTSMAAKYFGFATLYISALVGGFFAQKRCKGAPFTVGLISGVVLFATVSVLSFVIPFDFSSGWSPLTSWLLRLPVIVLSIAGALLAEYKPKKKRRR